MEVQGKTKPDLGFDLDIALRYICLHCESWFRAKDWAYTVAGAALEWFSCSGKITRLPI